ncbi:hypothetical protein [Dongshaea marina]|uniref:hypothetical protein n=1 Tax=Dongshaea marina TaxID=2047966 RepID=UPI00131EE5A1|nr:hypothetical protein [Dongshaea marina]
MGKIVSIELSEIHQALIQRAAELAGMELEEYVHYVSVEASKKVLGLCGGEPEELG